MAEEGQVIGCHDVESWKEHIQKGIDLKQLVVVDFTASWCAPCRVMAPILADIAKRMPHVIFLKVDVDELSTIAEEWEVEAMPTFIFLKEGKLVDKIVGVQKEELHAKINEHGAAPTASA